MMVAGGVIGEYPNSYDSRLIEGDCLTVMESLPRGEGFDVIIADPPYNIGKDFGNYSDSRPLAEYVKWTQHWLEQCFRLLAQDGIIYVYGFPEILAHIAVQYPPDEQRWLAWHYTNKSVPSARFWQRSHESILCLWQPGSGRPRLEVEQIREPYTESYMGAIGKVRAGTESRFGRSGVKTSYNDNGGALPRDVLKIPALAGGAGGRERWFMCRDCGGRVYPPAELKNHRNCTIIKHPTQKPMELTRRLILSKINGAKINGKNGKVLIPFAGSGSECVVADEMGVDWLGIEINADYISFARQFIAKKLSKNRHNDIVKA